MYEQQIKELQEQLKELRKNKVPLPVPWGNSENEDFTQNKKDHLLRKISAYKPSNRCQAINLIVIGNYQSGKSSLVNTFHTVLRNSDQISTITTVYGPSVRSVTKKLFEVKLRKDGQIKIFDCRGIPIIQKTHHHKPTPFEEDFMKTIAGHIKTGYVFPIDRIIEDNEIDRRNPGIKEDNEIYRRNPGIKEDNEFYRRYSGIKKDSEFYRRNPGISDKMHCVLFVVSAAEVQQDKHIGLMRIQSYLADTDVPVRLMLTKVDKLDLCGSGDLSGIFRSRHAQIKVNQAKQLFDFHDCQILPIANYTNGSTQNNPQDVLALLALDNILQEAMAYIDNES